MTTIQFYDQADDPVEIGEVDTRGELSRAIIDDGPPNQSTLKIDGDAIHCQKCSRSDCEHVELIEGALGDHDLR